MNSGIFHTFWRRMMNIQMWNPFLIPGKHPFCDFKTHFVTVLSFLFFYFKNQLSLLTKLKTKDMFKIIPQKMLIFKHMLISTQKYLWWVGDSIITFSLFLQLMLVSTWSGYDFTSAPMYYYDGKVVNPLWGAP